MNRLCSPKKAVPLLLSLGLALNTGAPVPSPARDASDCNDAFSKFLPAWTWVEHYHVQRGHKLTDFGTFGSLLTAADNQTILSPPFVGDNSTAASFLGTIQQDLRSGGVLIAYAEGGTSYTLDPIIGDSLGTNGLAEPANVYLARLYLLQNLTGRHLQLALGRIELSDFFDTNRVATWRSG
jgi:hypothetical protein